MSGAPEEGGFPMGRIEPVRRGAAYRLALLPVTLLVVLLPAIYVGLVAAAARLWWWWTVAGGPDLVATFKARYMVWTWIGLVVVGALLLLFLVKPMFAPRPPSPRPIALSRDREPRLFAFIDAVCAAVAAPAPREVCVDTAVNASASLKGFFGGFLAGHLRLTIGLPLVRGLSKRQFAGVLAHEFGHFTQRSAMRLGAVLHTINAWFYRVAMERDRWDLRLEKWSRADFRVAWMIWVARLLVWLTRRLLYLLMSLSHAVSCALLRQMEYDADRHEARLSGAGGFASTARRLRELTVGAAGARADAERAWADRRLPEDFAGLVVANVAQVPESVWAEVEAAVATAKTGAFHTHPADRDRLAAVEREGEEGTYLDESPAADLLGDIDALGREATRAYFRNEFGVEAAEDHLASTAVLVDEAEADRRGAGAINRFFQGVFSPEGLPGPAPEPAGEADAAARTARLAKLREELVRAAEHSRESKAIGILGGARERMAVLDLAEACLEAKLGVKPEALGLRSLDADGVASARAEARAFEASAEEGLSAVRSILERRLALGLALLADPGMPARRPDAVARERELRELLDAAGRVRELLPAMLEIRRGVPVVANLYEAHAELRADKRFVRVMSARCEALKAALLGVPARSFPLPAALRPPGEPADVGAYLVPEPPGKPQVKPLLAAAHTALHRFALLSYRLCCALATAGEAAEEAAGLAPLPAPPRPEGD